MAENPVFLSQKPKKFPLKIFLVAIFLIFILIGIGIFSFYWQEKKLKENPINFLPYQSSFYFRFKTNPKEPQVKNFKELLNRFPNYQTISEKIDQTFLFIKSEIPILKNFDFSISKEIILAAVGPVDEKTEKPPLVLIFPNPDLKKVEKITKDFEKEKENWEIKKESYKGRTIIKAKPKYYSGYFLPKEFETALTLSDDQFFISFSSEDLKRIIDVAEDKKLVNLFKKGKSKSLSENSEYKKIEKYLPKDYLFSFYSQLELEKILKTTGVEEIAEKKIPPFLASLKSIFNLPFLKKEEEKAEKVILAGAIIADKEGIKSESYYLDLRKEKPQISTFSIENSLSNFLPEKIGEKEIVYYQEARNLKNLFNQLEKGLAKRAGEKEEFEKMLKEIEEEIGINLKDLFSLFERNFAFFIAAKNENEKPIVSFVFEIEDEEKAKNNLLKIRLPKPKEKIDLFGLEKTRTKARDAKIISEMRQLMVMAEMIYDSEGSYRNFKCTYKSDFGDLSSVCQEIKKDVGSEPIIHQTRDKYCAYTKLATSNQYYCFDSTGNAISTYIFPGKTGYCTGLTFLCPKVLGTAPPEEIAFPEKVGFSKEIVEGFEIYSLSLFDDLGLFFSTKENKLILTFEKNSLIEILKSLKNTKKLRNSSLFSEKFKKMPENLTEISFIYPYGFSGPIKYAAKFFINFLYSFQTGKMPPPEKIVPIAFEFLEKGIFPYLKVLNSASSFTFSLQKDLLVSKGELKIVELSEKEKEETEEFWENIREWIEEKTFYLQSYEEVESKQIEYTIFSKEIAYRGTAGQNARLPIVKIFIPQNTKISKVEAYLEAFNRDPTYARSVGIAIGKEIPTDCKANYYLTLGPDSTQSKNFNLDPELFKPGINLITSWISTYGEWGGVESWITLKLKFYYTGDSPKLLEEISILTAPIDPISCKPK
jgi:RNA binding exosome subunit